jgi:cell division protein FtsB
MSLEKDLGSMRNLFEARTAELTSQKKELKEQKTLREGEEKKYSMVGLRGLLAEFFLLLTVLQYRTFLAEQGENLNKKKAELQKVTDELALSKKQVERQTAKLQEAATGVGSGSSREAILEDELKRTMVRLPSGPSATILLTR